MNTIYKVMGGEPVVGKIECLGAKNFSTKAMVASLLSTEKTTLHNIPEIGDVDITIKMLSNIGVKINKLGHNLIEIDPSTLNTSIVTMPDSRSNRIPILLLSVLLHKFNHVSVPTVGGDGIGRRNVDFHLEAIRKFGGTIEITDKGYVARCRNKLKGCHIKLSYPSVGATETCLFLAVLAEGTSLIDNIAIEPEITQLIAMLNSMGAIIFIKSDRQILVQGTDKLCGTNIHIMGDRIEAASWASLACASKGEITVSGIDVMFLNNFLCYYNAIGGGYDLIDENTIKFYRKSKSIKHILIETDVYPGFSTDWQQPFCTLLTQADGISAIHETVHDQRFGYLNILNKLGAKTQVTHGCVGAIPCRYRGYNYGHSALIYGPTTLHASTEPIEIPDLRAGLAYIIAAILAEGKTILTAVEQVERGYGDLSIRLRNTNINLTRMNKN